MIKKQMSVDDFFETVDTKTDSEPKPVAGRKRKAAIKEDQTDLKKRARLYCKCPEQWRAVSRYNPKRLEEFCMEQEFLNQKELYDSIFGFVHSMIGSAMDAVSGADGCVKHEIENDVSLRQAIEHEGSHFAQLLSNRFKIIALTLIDTYNGKQKEIKQRPPAPVIEEVKDESDERSQNTELDEQSVQHQPTTNTDEEEAEGDRQV